MSEPACPPQVDAPSQDATTQAQLLAVQLQALSSRISAVIEISAALNRSLKLADILAVIKQQVKWLLDFHYGGLLLVDLDGVNRFNVLFSNESSADDHQAMRTILEQTMATQRPQLRQVGAEFVPVTAFQSWLTMPIESEGQLWGALGFASLYAAHYAQDDLRIAHLLAIQLANAIRNATHFAEINSLYSKLTQTYQELQRAEERRDDMMHMVVHDLRNPLNVINISLDLLRDLLQQQQVVDRFQSIDRARRASGHMSNLINDMLDFSKLEDQEYHAHFTLFPLTDLLTELATEWQLYASKEQKQLQLEWASDLPQIAADLRLIRRVLDNLLSNAFKFTLPGDTICLGARARLDGIEVYVTDSGPGIPVAYQQRIFDKFFQVTTMHGEPFSPGAGLGLAFCKLAVAVHGGAIWVESQEQQGSTFRFTLPKHQQACAFLAPAALV